MVWEHSRVDTYLNIWRINDHPLKWNVSWECIFFLKLFIFQIIIWLYHFPLSSRQTLSYTTTCIKCKCVGLLLILYSCFCICCLFISLFWVLGSKASIFAVLGSILIASYIHNPVLLLVTFYIWNSFHCWYRTIQGSLLVFLQSNSSTHKSNHHISSYI